MSNCSNCSELIHFSKIIDKLFVTQKTKCTRDFFFLLCFTFCKNFLFSKIFVVCRRSFHSKTFCFFFICFTTYFRFWFFAHDFFIKTQFLFIIIYSFCCCYLKNQLILIIQYALFNTYANIYRIFLVNRCDEKPKKKSDWKHKNQNVLNSWCFNLITFGWSAAVGHCFFSLFSYPFICLCFVYMYKK